MWDLGIVSAGDFATIHARPLNASIGDEILSVPGVERPANGHTLGMRSSRIEMEGREVEITSFDDPGDQRMRDILFQSDDEHIGLRVSEMFTRPELLVLASDAFVRQSHLRIGDKVKIPLNDGFVEAKLIGQVNDFTIAGGSIYMDRKKYQALWNDPLITAFAVKVKQGFDIDEVRRAIDGKLAQKRDLLVIKSAEVKQQLGVELERGVSFMSASKYAIMAVVLIGLVNTFLISILERKREIGMLRAVGTSRGQLIVTLLSETIGQGLICAVFTLLLGIPIVKLWIQYPFSDILGWNLKFQFPLQGLVEILFAGSVVAAMAALIPIFYATQAQITEALRYE
jgi:putative ABC transport system permease protein